MTTTKRPNYEKSLKCFIRALQETSSINDACILADKRGFNPAVHSDAWKEAIISTKGE